MERFCLSKLVVWPFTDSCVEGRDQMLPEFAGKEAYVRFPSRLLVLWCQVGLNPLTLEFGAVNPSYGQFCIADTVRCQKQAKNGWKNPPPGQGPQI